MRRVHNGKDFVCDGPCMANEADTKQTSHRCIEFKENAEVRQMKRLMYSVSFISRSFGSKSLSIQCPRRRRAAHIEQESHPAVEYHANDFESHKHRRLK